LTCRAKELAARVAIKHRIEDLNQLEISIEKSPEKTVDQVKSFEKNRGLGL
jgi:hypothetical protein